jgi:hypothetical protein
MAAGENRERAGSGPSPRSTAGEHKLAAGRAAEREPVKAKICLPTSLSAVVI